jgi:multidrug resistance protein MdtO
MVEEITAKEIGWLPEALTRARWFEWLRRELAPFPGRREMTIRLVVGAVLVTVISMSLQVPEAALSAYMVFFVTKENRVVTALTGVLLILGATIAIAASLLLFRVTLDFPALRIVTMAAILFVGMYLSRVFVLGPLGFAIGFVMAVAQSFVDTVPGPELAVRGLLWIWIAVVYPIALTVLLNQVLLPAHPRTALTQSLTRRLDAVIAALQRLVNGRQPDEHTSASFVDLATRGSASLFKLLHFAEGKDPQLAAHHAAQSAIILATERLATAAAALEMRLPGPLADRDRTRAKALIEEIDQLRTAIQGNAAIQPLETVAAPRTDLLELRELELAASSLRTNLAGGTDVPVPQPPPSTKTRKSLFVADAFTNPAHVHFALKVTLAAMTCYFIYTGVDWSGIHTSFITCCFIALESTGASLRKGWLRLTGCLLGGGLGFLAILHLVPHMESIASLALLIAAVSTLAGWVAAGSERIAYAGLQIAFAFYLAIFQGFAPATDLDVIRDRIAGIILGIFVMSLVFRYLWPERVVGRLRTILAHALRHLARLRALPQCVDIPEAFAKEATGLRADATACIDEGVRLAGLAMFEEEHSGPVRPRRIEALIRRIQNLYLTTTTLTSEAASIDRRSVKYPHASHEPDSRP